MRYSLQFSNYFNHDYDDVNNNEDDQEYGLAKKQRWYHKTISIETRSQQQKVSSIQCNKLEMSYKIQNDSCIKNQFSTWLLCIKNPEQSFRYVFSGLRLCFYCHIPN